MGFLGFLKKHKDKKGKEYVQPINSYFPTFNQFGNDIYASDVVQQAIRCVASEMSKLSPNHIKEKGMDIIPVKSNVQMLLDNPNNYMTTSDFIFKIIWNLYQNYNSYIIPTYTTETDINGNYTKKYTGLYPVVPSTVQLLTDEEGNFKYYYFQFASGYEVTLPVDNVIHIRYCYSLNEYKGGNALGEPDNKSLLKTLDLNDTMLNGVGKALKSSFAINGIVKYASLVDEEKMDNAMRELERHLNNNEHGFLPIDLNSEFIPLQNKIEFVNNDTLKFIDEKILRNFGVSIPILTGDYTKAQYEAFYQKTLEPLIILLGQEFTKKLLTERERAFGNKIKFYPHELIFMDTQQKIDLFDKLVDTASCYKNELRTAFGMAPLPELAGQLAISSNKNNALNNDGTVKNNTNENIKTINSENGDGDKNE